MHDRTHKQTQQTKGTIMFNAIALVPISNQSTCPHNIRVGGYKKETSARKALDAWCVKHNVKFGYVQKYGDRQPLYVRGV